MLASWPFLNHPITRLLALISIDTVNTSNHYDVIVIGGGAAGLMCAWQAGLRGKRVVVLERSKKLGRKILMSGGGRCNFTNLYIEPDNFICSNPHFVKSALSQYTAWDFIGNVVKHNIAYHERDHGQLFCDDSAKQIVDMLVQECNTVSVDLVMQCDIFSVAITGDAVSTTTESEPSTPLPARFTLNSSKGAFSCVSLVVATGGLTIPSMQPTPFGYELARQFGLSVLPIRASLVPYTFTGALKDMFARLSGNAIPSIVHAGKQHFREALLFTHRGLSGPVVLQVSNYWQQGDPISIDLIPDLNVSSSLTDAKLARPKSLVRTVLAQSLPKNLVLEFEQLWWPEHKELSIGDWPNTKLAALGEKFNNWEVVPSGTEGYRTAEVTLGGVDTNELSSKTMQAKKQSGLYFIGEVVDVTGHLGGFNFQWAWSSAYACAKSV